MKLYLAVCTLNFGNYCANCQRFMIIIDISFIVRNYEYDIHISTLYRLIYRLEKAEDKVAKKNLMMNLKSERVENKEKVIQINVIYFYI